MRTAIGRWGVGAIAALSISAVAGAQDLIVTNARILDGTGRVIERGAVLVRNGRIESVSADLAAPDGVPVIDARGRTVMPGFIDSHRHVAQFNAGPWLEERAPQQLQEFLAAGFTTVLAALDAPQVIEARKRIERGQLKGPRLFVAAFIPLAAPTPGAAGGPRGDAARTDPARLPLPPDPAPAIPREATIKAVEAAAQAGYDYLKAVVNVTPNGPEVETLKLIVQEGRKRGLPTIAHAVGIRETLAALEAGPDALVHTPHIGHLGDDPEAVKKIVAAGIPMSSTLAVFLPHFNDRNEPVFRDGQPFPWHTISSAGQGPVNARLLWEAGIVAYGYGTDTQWPPKVSLADELRALELVFSPADIVSIITKHAARATLHGDELGTLEPGKFADMVIIDGDPLRNARDLLKVVTTIKGGEVVFEAGT